MALLRRVSQTRALFRLSFLEGFSPVNPSAAAAPLIPSRCVHLQIPQFAAHPTGFGDWDKPQELPGSNETHTWPAYNERIYLPTGEYRPAFVCHMRDNIKYSPQKMWYIANMIRGLSIDEALKQLQFVNKKGAVIAMEVLEEARELAVKEHNVEFRSNLWVAESFAHQAKIVKNMRRHARGRVGMISHRYMHYYVRLEEGSPPKDYWETFAPKFNAKEMLEEWVQERRQIQIPKL